MKIKNVLLIDIPTYKVELEERHRKIIDRRLLYVVNMGGTHFDFSYRDFPFPVIADYTPAICC